MASALQKKPKKITEAGNHPITDLTRDNHRAISETSPFTAEQRQILGNVYQLILSWRRERLMKTTPQIALTSSSLLPAEGES